MKKALTMIVIMILGLPILITPSIEAKKETVYEPLPSNLFTSVVVPSLVPVIEESFIFRRRILAQPEVIAELKPKPKVEVKPKPRPKPVIVIRTSHSLRGIATWYCNYDDPHFARSICMAVHPDRRGVADLYAAAGPALRRAICGRSTSNCWRSKLVTAWYGKRHVTVRLSDWCACGGGHIIDLYRDAMDILGLRWGGNVIVRW